MSRMSLDTAIRLSAEVKGGGNIDRVKRSLQELGQAAQVTKRDKTALRTATLQLARANDGTIAGIRTSVAALRGLQEQARIGSREFQKYGAEIQRLQGKLDGLNGSAKATGAGLGQQLAGGLATAGIGMALRGITMQAGKFDAEVRKAAAIEGGAGSFSVLQKEIEKVAAAAAGTPTEVAALATALSRAGFTAEETTQSLAGIVRGAEATAVSFEQMGSIAADNMRAFGLETSQVSQIVDVLTQASNKSNQTVLDIGESMKYSAPVAKTLGVSIEDLAATLGLMANAGIRGSDAGTGLRMGLFRLQTAAGGADEEIQSLTRGNALLAKAMDVLGAQILDTQGKLKPMDQVILALKDSFAKLSISDQAILAKALFGTEAASKFLATMNFTESKIREMFGYVRDAGGVAEETQKKMQGFNYSIVVAGGNVEYLANQIGGMIGVALKPMIDLFNMAIGAAMKLPDPIRNIGAAAAAAGIATLGLAVAINTVKSALAVVGGIKAVSAALIGYKAAATGATVAQAGLNLAVLANPWVALAAGITAATIALSRWQTQSQKVGAAARTGDPSSMVTARTRLDNVSQEISLLNRSRESARGPQRASYDRQLTKLQAEQNQLRADIQAGNRLTTPPSAVELPVVSAPTTGGGSSGGGAGSEAAEKAAKAAEAAGRKYEAEQIRMQARLAENQLQANEGLQRNAIELDNQRYENSKSLALKQFEFTQTIQSRALNLWSEGLMGPARASAKLLTEFMMGFSEGISRVAEAQRTVNDARRALQQAETVHKQTLANMTERQRIEALESRAQAMGSAGGGNGVGGLMAAANKNLGLFAGQTERCADAIRKLFQEAGIAIGVTKKAWDGLATGPRMASSFFGDDIGQRINRKEDLRSGDLVGFERTYGRWGPGVQTHVGMYAGGGMMFDHSSSRGVVRRPLDTFGGKFMYGVRPHALAQGAAVPMSQRLLPGADMPAFQPAPVRNVGGEGDIAQARERLKQAEKELALIKEQSGELRKFDREEFTQKLTQGLIDQNQELENNAKELQLRNRLTMEGVSSNVIEAELQKAKIYQDQALVIAGLKEGIDAIKDSEDKAAALAALEKMNGLYARQIELIDQAVAAQLDQPAAIALQIGQLKADLAEMVSISTLAGRSADGIGSAFGNAFQELITGAASAREVLAGFFQDVAQNFAQMAAEIIAKQMTMIVLQTILKALGAVAGAAPDGGNMADVGRYADSSSAVTMADFPALPRALGGGVSAGRPYPVGENGPELFVPYQAGTIIPAEATEALQSINSASLRGLSVPFQATAPTAGTSSQQGSAAASTSGLSVPFQRGMEGLSVPFQRGGIDGGMGAAGMGAGGGDSTIRFESVVINNQEFVTRQEAEAIGRRSEKRGAALAHKRNVNNVTIRRQAGFS